jgi:predicted alpha/beta-hydrolase family hydrolase
MTSTAQSQEALPGVVGLAFLGFPLHPPGQPGVTRAQHLDGVNVPMLFLQGDRDEFAELILLRQVAQRLGKPALLHVVKGGDHSFNVPKSAGRTAEDVRGELADGIVAWAASLDR